MSQNKNKIIPVLMVGGAGTRLWPLSRGKMPKQFLPLLGPNTLFQETLLRFQDERMFSSAYILAHEKYKFLVQEQCAQLHITPSTVFMEPESKNTAIAVAVASAYANQESGDNIVLLTPSDHAIADNFAYKRAVEVGITAAQDGRIVTFGIHPVYPETGYGYIKLGQVHSDQEHIYAVENFLEKPSVEKARRFIETGGFVWNSGMFMARADILQAEIEHSSPELFEAALKILSSSRKEDSYISLTKDIFSTVPSISFDYAVMEKTKKAVVVPVNMGWSDIGSWSSLAQYRKKDDQGNSFEGNIVANEVKNSTVFGGRRLIALQGVEDIIVVDTDDALLVTNKETTQSLKALVDKIGHISGTLLEEHSVEKRSWGHYQVLNRSGECKIKRLVVLPKMSTSYQSHKHRSEHWFVVSGVAEVLIEGNICTLNTGQSIDIPMESKHQLKNASDTELHVVEIQTGTYFGEDDIERHELPTKLRG